MKRLVAMISLAALEACGLIPAEPVDPRFLRLLESKVPAMQVGLIEAKRSGTVLLEQRRGAHEIWLTPDGATITMEQGMLHGTRGFGQGLLASELSEPLALVRTGRAGASDRFHTYLDGDDRTITRTYRCIVRVRGPRDIQLSSGVARTRLLEEDCRSLNQEFENLYWIELPTGTIVQSRQWAGPFLGAISTRIVR